MVGTVWILGAGFSIPLGGPSFRDLISESLRVQASQLMTMEQRQWATTVQHVYESGLRGALRRSNAVGVELWRDPEEYIELVELAMNNAGSNNAEIIAQSCYRHAPHDQKGAPPESESERKLLLRLLHRESVRFCAAACSIFLAHAEADPETALETEKWEPYLRWKRKQVLQVGDTVVTFNWDRVLDFLPHQGGTPLEFVLPAEEPGPADPNVVPVLHLHGHVGWQRVEADDVRVIRDKDRFAAVKRPELAVLGTPGGSKKMTSETLLLPLWKLARSAVKAANTVVFIGYRFPPSDNYAKHVLLSGLKESVASRIHVVLGPKSDDVARLKGLLRWSDPENGPAREILVHEMGTEDFLAVVERRHL